MHYCIWRKSSPQLWDWTASHHAGLAELDSRRSACATGGSHATAQASISYVAERDHRRWRRRGRHGPSARCRRGAFRVCGVLSAATVDSWARPRKRCSPASSSMYVPSQGHRRPPFARGVCVRLGNTSVASFKVREFRYLMESPLRRRCCAADTASARPAASSVVLAFSSSRSRGTQAGWVRVQRCRTTLHIKAEMRPAACEPTRARRGERTPISLLKRCAARPGAPFCRPGAKHPIVDYRVGSLWLP